MLIFDCRTKINFVSIQFSPDFKSIYYTYFMYPRAVIIFNNLLLLFRAAESSRRKSNKFFFEISIEYCLSVNWRLFVTVKMVCLYIICVHSTLYMIYNIYFWDFDFHYYIFNVLSYKISEVGTLLQYYSMKPGVDGCWKIVDIIYFYCFEANLRWYMIIAMIYTVFLLDCFSCSNLKFCCEWCELDESIMHVL